MSQPLNTCAVVLCRMDSQRLPGKTLTDVAGKPLLWYITDRLRHAQSLTQLPVIATTDRPVDQPIIDWANTQGLPTYRGSCDDVASRFLEAAQHMKADIAFRINGDSPMLDPSLIDEANKHWSPHIDYVTNLQPRSFPYGVAIQGLRVSRYAESLTPDVSMAAREHVTQHVHDNLSSWHYVNIQNKDSKGQPIDQQKFSMTIDTPEQLERFRAFITSIQAGVPWHKVGFQEAINFGGF